MRLMLSLAIAPLLVASVFAAPAFAQDTRAFNATGATEAKACAAAKADAQSWAKRGKSEGRRREIESLGDCACTPAGNQVTCRVDAKVTDEVYEEEEEG